MLVAVPVTVAVWRRVVVLVPVRAIAVPVRKGLDGRVDGFDLHAERRGSLLVTQETAGFGARQARVVIRCHRRHLDDTDRCLCSE